MCPHCCQCKEQTQAAQSMQAQATQSPAHPHSQPGTRELGILQSLEFPPLQMWDVWKGYTCSAGAETTKFPKLWNAGLGLLRNATTFPCSWINPEVCCFNTKTASSNRAALLEMAKVKTRSFRRLCWAPRPPKGSCSRENRGCLKSTSAYETLTVCQAQ